MPSAQPAARGHDGVGVRAFAAGKRRIDDHAIGRVDLMGREQRRPGRHRRDRQTPVLHHALAVVARSQPDVQPCEHAFGNTAAAPQKAVPHVAQRGGADDLDVARFVHKRTRITISSSSWLPTMNA